MSYPGSNFERLIKAQQYMDERLDERPFHSFSYKKDRVIRETIESIITHYDNWNPPAPFENEDNNIEVFVPSLLDVFNSQAYQDMELIFDIWKKEKETISF